MAEWTPACTIAEAHARLTAPGSPFETDMATIRGLDMRVWRHAPPNLQSVLKISAAAGARPAFVLGSERVSHAEHAAAAAAVAAWLRARGVRPGERVAIALRNRPAFSACAFGAVLAGAIPALLNAWENDAALERAIALADPRALLLEPDIAARLGRGATPEDIVGPSSAWGRLPAPPEPDLDPRPDDDAALFFTSGTTGAPRAVMVTHRNLLTGVMNLAFAHARSFVRRGERPPQPGDAPPPVTLLPVPLFHATGFVGCLLASLIQGGALALMERWRPHEALAIIAREGVTHVAGVPTIALDLLRALSESAEADLSSLRFVTYGGAAPPAFLADTLRASLPGAQPATGWGMTETCATAFSNLAEDYAARPHSCGPVPPVLEARVTDEADAPLPCGAAGLLQVRGPSVARGYWRDPEATRAAFSDDGWLRTGDIARIDAEGFVSIVGRAKDLIARGGEKIVPAEIEEALLSHPGVAEAAVFGAPHPRLGEVPVAVVVARSGAIVTENMLLTLASERLSAYKRPARIVVSASPLPRNAAGKTVKADLRATHQVEFAWDDS